MSEKLKPCPFCGGKAVVHTTSRLYRHDFYTPQCRDKLCILSNNTSRYPSIEDAVAAWNMRAKA